MKKYLFILLLIFAATDLFAQQNKQSFDQVDFLEALGQKKIASVEDAQNLFQIVLNNNLPYSSSALKKDEPVKKGYAAYIVAVELGLTDSLLFNLSKSQRYALKACVAHNLLNADGSENDMMSGEELIEFLRLASEYREKGAPR